MIKKILALFKGLRLTIEIITDRHLTFYGKKCLISELISRRS